MRSILLTIICLNVGLSLHAQGITLLYKNDTGWDNPLSWIQMNTPSGQTPIQRVPTYLDDVVFSQALSGIEYVSMDIGGAFVIGGGSESICRSMHISNTTISFDGYLDAGAPVDVYTSNGGYVLLDSGAVLHHGQFSLHGGNPAIKDLQVIDSKFGDYTQHNADWAGLHLEDSGWARFIGSTFDGFNLSTDPNEGSKGGLYAQNSSFNLSSFVLTGNTIDTFLNSSIEPNGNNVGVNFLIGRNASFVSQNASIFSVLTGAVNFTTSGAVFNGNITGWYINFLQEDPANPLPNIINGDVILNESQGSGISGEVKISGNLVNHLPSFGFDIDTASVIVNGVNVFEIGGITNFGNKAYVSNCAQDFCHYKMEFFGNSNSNIDWGIGFPVDTLIINKSSCAKVTCTNSLYVAGATRIENGQLILEPNDTIAYKFVCAGNVDIAQGGGLLLQKDAAGVAANMAIGGTLTDHNPVADPACAGLSNPYGGTVTFYSPALPLTLLDFYGRYSNKAIALGWSTEREIDTKYFSLEKSFDAVSFVPLANIAASVNTQGKKTYGYTDNTPLKGVNYYRLKMVDADGRFTYSKIIAIATPITNAMMVFPNPVKDKLFIRLSGVGGAAEIVITDARGTVTRRLQLRAVTAGTSVDVATLAAGVYSISFQSAKFKSTQQFIKQ